MHDVLGVDIHHCIYHLDRVHASLVLRQSLTPFYELLQGVELAVLQNNVDVLRILEHVLEPDDALVAEAAVQFDLQDELVALFLLVDVFLRNDLRRVNLLVLGQTLDFEAFGETASPKQPSADVLFVATAVAQVVGILHLNRTVIILCKPPKSASLIPRRASRAS